MSQLDEDISKYLQEMSEKDKEDVINLLKQKKLGYNPRVVPEEPAPKNLLEAVKQLVHDYSAKVQPTEVSKRSNGIICDWILDNVPKDEYEVLYDMFEDEIWETAYNLAAADNHQTLFWVSAFKEAQTVRDGKTMRIAVAKIVAREVMRGWVLQDKKTLKKVAKQRHPVLTDQHGNILQPEWRHEYEEYELIKHIQDRRNEENFDMSDFDPTEFLKNMRYNDPDIPF